jgi:hypothetical protein
VTLGAARFPGFLLDDAGKEQTEQADECVNVDLLIGPVILGPDRQVRVVFALAAADPRRAYGTRRAHLCPDRYVLTDEENGAILRIEPAS